jgi:hypothetical protein
MVDTEKSRFKMILILRLSLDIPDLHPGFKVQIGNL